MIQQFMNKPNTVFVDTSFFKGLLDPADDFHQRAKDGWQKLKEEDATIIVSNYVLDESFTLIRLRCGIKIADKLREDIIKSSHVIKIMRVTVADEADAWKWFLNDWSKLSFTDCVSFAVMKRLDIVRVATFDEHFKKAGFTIVS